MADVIDLSARRAPDEKPVEMFLCCGACHCQSFFLRDDGVNECTNCGSLGGAALWVKSAKDAPVEEADELEPEPFGINIINFGNEAAARKRIMSRITDDTLAVIILHKESGLFTWKSELILKDRREWIECRMLAAVDMLVDHGSS